MPARPQGAPFDGPIQKRPSDYQTLLPGALNTRINQIELTRIDNATRLPVKGINPRTVPAPESSSMHRSNDALDRYAVRNQALFHGDIVPSPIPACGLHDIGTCVGSRYRTEEVWVIGSGQGPGDIRRAFLCHPKQLGASGQHLTRYH